MSVEFLLSLRTFSLMTPEEQLCVLSLYKLEPRRHAVEESFVNVVLRVIRNR